MAAEEKEPGYSGYTTLSDPLVVKATDIAAVMKRWLAQDGNNIDSLTFMANDGIVEKDMTKISDKQIRRILYKDCKVVAFSHADLIVCAMRAPYLLCSQMPDHIKVYRNPGMTHKRYMKIMVDEQGMNEEYALSFPELKKK